MLKEQSEKKPPISQRPPLSSYDKDQDVEPIEDPSAYKPLHPSHGKPLPRNKVLPSARVPSGRRGVLQPQNIDYFNEPKMI